MIDYDSFSRCHLTDIFFAIFARAKELTLFKTCLYYHTPVNQITFQAQQILTFLAALFSINLPFCYYHRFFSSQNCHFISLLHYVTFPYSIANLAQLNSFSFLIKIFFHEATPQILSILSIQFSFLLSLLLHYHHCHLK